MKLVYLAQSAIPSKAANSIHVMKMCSAFSVCGIDVELVVPDMGRASLVVDDVFEYYGIEHHFPVRKIPFLDPLGSRLKYLVSAGKMWKGFKRAIGEISPDLVYGRSVIGCHAGASLGIPSILEVHQPVWNSFVERKLLESMAKKDSFKQLVVITNALGMLYKKENIVGETTITVAPDAADVLSFDDFPADWTGRKGCLQAGYIGSMHAGRGVELVLDLARRMADVDFHMVGGDSADLERIRREADYENVHMYGFVPPAIAHQYRNACDVLLAPYQTSIEVHGGGGNTAAYCSPLKIFEYMSARKPILISDLPVFHEVLNSSNAIMLSPTDVEAWEDALRLLHDEQLRGKYAAVAYDDFVNNYTWKQRAKNILASIEGDVR